MINGKYLLSPFKRIFYLFTGLFKAKVSEDNDNECNIYLDDHYIVNGKDYGNIGLDFERSRSYKVMKHICL